MNRTAGHKKFRPLINALTSVIGFTLLTSCQGQPSVQFTLSFEQASRHQFHVQMHLTEWDMDSLTLKMPTWMPGFYQYMHYAAAVTDFQAYDGAKSAIQFEHPNENTWLLTGTSKKEIFLDYDIITSRRFVANSYVDSLHAYIIPESAFLYPDGHLDLPSTIKLIPQSARHLVATGLTPQNESNSIFYAPDFDILYDSPILVGDLQELPSFEVRGVGHRFFAYQPGDFDQERLIDGLHKVVESAVEIFNDIPYQEYTFLGIGPGRGGIEHLNNTSFGFSGDQLRDDAGYIRMFNFLGHEYFHHYNVKRIRPFELGPFDYDKGSKTNLLWVSEGLSVYYEYITVRRAGLVDEATLLNQFAGNIKGTEEDPGLPYQSLAQASYATWQDGPFGGNNGEDDRSISYYEKGPVVGLLLDFTIRHATQNESSLDDVMRMLYKKYYKAQGRGFTDAEFQQTCEEIAGIPLDEFFEYIYTTKPLDYDRYLAYGGLTLIARPRAVDPSSTEYLLERIPEPDELQKKIYADWVHHE